MITNIAISNKKLEEFFMGSSNSIDIPELTRIDGSYLINLFINQNNLQSITLANLEQFPFTLTSSDLRTVNLTSLKRIRPWKRGLNSEAIPASTAQFLTNTKLQVLILPNLIGYEGTEYSPSPAFANNYYLRVVDLGSETLEHVNNYYFGAQWFLYNYFLEKIILRYSFVMPLSGQGGLFDYSPFLTGSPKAAHFYVPKRLITAYRAASNWSNFGANAFLTIEDDLEQDFTATSDTITKSWAEIVADCNNAEAGSSNLDTSIYKIGRTKTVEIDGCPTQMVIAGINKDYIAPVGEETTTGGNTTAAITWIERTISRFTPINMSAVGGYNNATNLQAELTRIYNNLPEELQAGIKTVQKLTSHVSNTNSVPTVSAEKVWIPSPGELNLGGASYDTREGFYGGWPISYDSYFNTVRPYYLGNSALQPSNAQLVGLRSWRNSDSRPDCLNNNGSYIASSSTIGNENRYLIMGFCT